MSKIDEIDFRLGNLLGMLDLLGLDPAEFYAQNHGRYFASAIPACLNCGQDAPCREWLGRQTDRVRRAPSFCPNAQVLAWAKDDAVRSRH